MPPPPPELMEEIVEEILLRFPPADPASLLRAALVCKSWRRLVSGAAFRRRFREFHRTPPMLGFICDWQQVGNIEPFVDYLGEGVFVPTTPSFRLPLHKLLYRSRQWDSRHGRVVVYDDSSPFCRLRVWIPIPDIWVGLPKMPLDHPDSYTATVLCAAATGTAGTCDHLDCQDGPFIVVLVFTNWKGMLSSVYSSKSCKWSEPTVAKHPGDYIISSNRRVLVKNALYFVFRKNDRILKYDLRTREMTPMGLPCNVETNLKSQPPVELMTTEDGRLGFARLLKSRLCLWSRPDDQDVGWVLSRAIDLQKHLPFDAFFAYCDGYQLVGFAEGVGVIFVSVGYEVFTVDLKSSKMVKVYERPVSCVVPYMSFCTPALRSASTDARSRSDASSAPFEVQS